MFGRSISLIRQTGYARCWGFLFITIAPVIVIHNILRERWIMNSSFINFQVGKMALTGLGKLFKSLGQLLSTFHYLQLLIGTWTTALSLHKGGQFGSGLFNV